MKNKIISLTSLITVLVFFVIGFTTNIWHPTWLVFLILPIVGAFLGTENLKDAIMGGTSLIIVLIFFLLPFIFGVPWHLSILVFIGIPILGVILYVE